MDIQNVQVFTVKTFFLEFPYGAGHITGQLRCSEAGSCRCFIPARPRILREIFRASKAGFKGPALERIARKLSQKVGTIEASFSYGNFFGSFDSDKEKQAISLADRLEKKEPAALQEAAELLLDTYRVFIFGPAPMTTEEREEFERKLQ